MELTHELKYQFPLIKGEDVRAAQLALLALKVDPPCGTADGIYGPATRDAVVAFQHLHPGLKEDGIVGPLTWSKLIAEAANKDAPARVIQAAVVSIVDTKPPLSQDQVAHVKRWMTEKFGAQMRDVAANSPFDIDLICAIACKETAPVWLRWIESHPSDEVLARCVFDASGDDPNSARSAFPVNTAAFRARYPELTDELIAEANATRALRGLGPKHWVYKGYGIFQYDLQHIVEDRDFFAQKQWCSFDACLDRLMRELKEKMRLANNNLQEAVRRYNGSGTRAIEYAEHVMVMRQWEQTTAVA